MTTRIFAVAGDTNRPITVTLSDDGTARDLTGVDAIECHVRDRSTGVATIITGLSGDAGGAVTATIATLTEGTFTVEFQVTDGALVTTYPGNGADRPLLVVRAEAD